MYIIYKERGKDKYLGPFEWITMTGGDNVLGVMQKIRYRVQPTQGEDIVIEVPAHHFIVKEKKWQLQ